MPKKSSVVGAGGMLCLGRRQSQVERKLYKAEEWSLGATEVPMWLGMPSGGRAQETGPEKAGSKVSSVL